MKKFILPALVVISLGLSIYSIIYSGRIKCPVNDTPTTTIIQQVAPRTSTDILTTSLLELSPANAPSPLREGMIWFDAANDAVRMWGGDYSGGMEIPRGRYATDVLTFNAGVEDTVEFPELIDIGLLVVYELEWDSVNSPLVTFTLEDKMATQHDSMYTTMSSSVFPRTLPQKFDGTKIFPGYIVGTDNRAIIDWDTASVGIATLTRKVYLMAKD